MSKQARIPADAVERVRSAADVVSVIGQEIELKAKASLFVASCPFHEETDPSFTVDPGRGRWRCYGCDRDGDVFGWVMERDGVRFPDAVRLLADRFNVELPDEAHEKPQERPTLGAVDVRRGWASLRTTTAAGAVSAWLRSRGVHPEIAEAAAQSDGVVHAEGGDPAEVAGILGYQPDQDDGPKPRRPLPFHKVGIALRDEMGKVRDVERRCTLPQREAEFRKATKSLRMNSDDRGGFAVVFFGHVERIRRVLLKGEPLIVVEGGPDWLVADGLCRLRGGGLAIGAAAGGVEAVARLIRRMIQSMARTPDRAPRVWLVPDLGDKTRQGEKVMLRAAGLLAGYAIGQWCVPVLDGRAAWSPRLSYRGRRWRSIPGPGVRDARIDLGDLAVNPPEQVLDALERAPAVLDEGPTPEEFDEGAKDPWRPVRFDRLRRFVDGLPLATIGDAIYWRIGKNGLFKQTRAECDWWLGDLVVLWLDRHGARFTHDENEEPLIYWPHGQAYDGRLFRVQSARWAKMLRGLSKIDIRSRDGLGVMSALRERCLEGRPMPIRPWSYSAITRHGGQLRGEVRLHLHDDDDRVAVARAGELTVEPNARAELHATRPKDVEPIRWMPATTPARGAELLYDRIAMWLTCDPLDRVLVVAWAILSLARHSLNLRPVLTFMGPAGVGKSGAAKLLSVGIHGKKRLIARPTPKSLYAAGDHPITAVDNVEERNRAGIEDWLLIAATGGDRTIGTVEGGVKRQRVDTFALLTSIVVSGRYELMTRMIPVENAKEWAAPGFSEAGVIDDIKADRSEMLCGVLRLWADHIWPRWAEVAELDVLVGPDHIAWRQRESLAALAIIGAALGEMDPRFTTLDARALLSQWIDRIEARVGFAAVQTDPVLFGLQSVMRAWNRITFGPGRYWQQWVDEEQAACRPLFIDGNEKVTARQGEARVREKRDQSFPVVVGCVGTHHELHADIVRALRPTGLHDRFLNEIPDGTALAARWTQVAGDGWERDKLDRPRVAGGKVGSWRYRFWTTSYGRTEQ